jgi:transglutaminase-like putative cysteine protease
MYPESDELRDYLVSDDIIDWQTPAVRKKALELTQSLTGEIDKARVLYEWVRDSIPHTHVTGLDVVTCTASEVLQHGTGICFAKSHLLAALLRSVGIPAGFCYQVLCTDPPDDMEPVLHGLNAVYLASLGRWIRVDARGNTNGIDARFSIKKEQLAFAMDPEADEFIYEAIFATPAQSVIESLRIYTSLDELWQDLPQSL